MIYVMSDIHGEFEKYKKMLQLIKFKDSDTLYVLGDVVDRGTQPIDVLIDMMNRTNVYPLMGNHELMALDILKRLNVEITEENHSTHIDSELMSNLIEYQSEGGESTIKQFSEQDAEQKEVIIEYMEEEFMPYEIVDAGGNSFLLVHSGLGNFSKEKDLDDYTLEELTFMRPDYSINYFNKKNLYIVSGHTPTIEITGAPEIYRSNNNICIDCGATYGGRLACLCLDTSEEFYID